VEGTKTCPFCSETLHVEALVCRYCDYDLRTGKPIERVTQATEKGPGPEAPIAEARSAGSRLLGLLWRLAATIVVVAMGLVVLVIWLAGSGPAVPTGCVRHVELHPASVWAQDLGRSESWVVANHKVNLWSKSSRTGSKGRIVGVMRPGSRAVVIEDDGTDYRVRSPVDGSIGWIGGVQVSRELWQDTSSRERCR